MRQIYILSLVGCILFSFASTAHALDLQWEWSPNESGYTSGPNGDIAYDLYMKTGNDPDYAYDYPLIHQIDDCVLQSDQYYCQVSVDYAFEMGVPYYFVVVAYLADDPVQRSASSNEIVYQLDVAADSAGSSGGGGCFIQP